VKENVLTGPVRARCMCIQYLHKHSQLEMLRLNLLIMQFCMLFRTSINHVINIIIYVILKMYELHNLPPENIGSAAALKLFRVALRWNKLQIPPPLLRLPSKAILCISPPQSPCCPLRHSTVGLQQTRWGIQKNAKLDRHDRPKFPLVTPVHLKLRHSTHYVSGSWNRRVT
jgi:hypothetical protein